MSPGSGRTFLPIVALSGCLVAFSSGVGQAVASESVFVSTVLTDAWIAPHADGDSVYVPAYMRPGGAEPLAAPLRGRGTITQEKETPISYCGSLDSLPTTIPCVDDAHSRSGTPTCADGSQARPPVKRRQIDRITRRAVTGWVLVDRGGCAEDVPAAPVLTAEDFQRLPLVPSITSYQPANGTGLVNMPLIVLADPAPQTLVATVLGADVTVRAIPTVFSWNFGDGSEVLATSDPGLPYPDQTVFHVYTTPGSYQVQLVTTWIGEYQVGGQGPWLAVTGTAQTTSPAYPETVVEAKSRLVDGPLP